MRILNWITNHAISEVVCVCHSPLLNTTHLLLFQIDSYDECFSRRKQQPCPADFCRSLQYVDQNGRLFDRIAGMCIDLLKESSQQAVSRTGAIVWETTDAIAQGCTAAVARDSTGAIAYRRQITIPLLCSGAMHSYSHWLSYGQTSPHGDLLCDLSWKTTDVLLWRLPAESLPGFSLVYLLSTMM